MRVPIEWLREFVRFRGTVPALAEALTLSGTEVERIDQPPKLGDGVRVGLVKTLVRHPAADRLRVAKVSLGRGPLRTIVCGAPNIAVHQKVAVVMPGTLLPGGMTIETREVRGVKSQGMIASEAELGTGTDASGILVLDPAAPLGVSVDRVRRTGPVLELEVTPNRADLLSVRGVAREVAALQGLALPKDSPLLDDHDAAAPVRVTVRDRRACPWYGARLVRGVTVQPSPRWMQDRLRAAGLTPKNAVVDVTNYVMLELGEPLHAFDAARVARVSGKPSIIVRPARTGERLTTLDGVDRKLRASTLVIADPKGALAVAGVSGGASSAVSDSTRDVILEAAWFDPVKIRATRRVLGITTDASARFERGVDRAVVPIALDRAAKLLAELAGGTIIHGRGLAATPLPKPTIVTTSVASTAALLGVPVSRARFTTSLTTQGFGVAFGKPTAREAYPKVSVTVPSWRVDIGIEADIADEVGRMIGLARLKPTLLRGALEPRTLPWLQRLTRRAEDLAVSFGATEAKLYAYQDRNRIGSGIPFEVKNPLSPEQQFLRRELAPALEFAARRSAREESTVFQFETGHVFLARGNALPAEPTHLTVVRIAPGPMAANYRHVRSLAQSIISLAETPPVDVMGRADFSFSIGSRRIASGYVRNREGGSLVVVEIDLTALSRFSEHRSAFRAIPNYPPVKRDLAFFLPPHLAYGRVEKFIRRFHPLLVDVETFDYYEREGRRSAAAHLTLQSLERTLMREEVDAVLRELTSALSKKFTVEVR
jgi:phenylalanyl-tRNA synthetase beta chain